MTIASFARRLTGTTLVLMLATVSTGHAQISKMGQITRGPVRFTTGFPFTVGNSNLPAGSYEIRPDGDGSGLFEINGQKVSALFAVQDAVESRVPTKSEVVFDRYGSRYILKNVWVEGSKEGLETIASEAERHQAKSGDEKSHLRVPATPVMPGTKKAK